MAGDSLNIEQMPWNERKVRHIPPAENALYTHRESPHPECSCSTHSIVMPFAGLARTAGEKLIIFDPRPAPPPLHHRAPFENWTIKKVFFVNSLRRTTGTQGGPPPLMNIMLDSNRGSGGLPHPWGARQIQLLHKINNRNI